MVKNASAGEKAGWSNGRTPLFSQKDLLRLVGPLLIEQFLAVTVGMADTMMVSRCGEAAISGVSLVDMINNLIIVLFAALATGGAVVVSQYLGAKEQKHANASSGQLILLSALLGVGVGVFCFVLARPMIRLCYGSIDADVLEAGVLYLRITAVSYPFLAMYNAGAALFRSMGNSKISMQISILMNIIRCQIWKFTMPTTGVIDTPLVLVLAYQLIFGTMISYCIYLVGVTMIGPSRAICSLPSSLLPPQSSRLCCLQLRWCSWTMSALCSSPSASSSLRYPPRRNLYLLRLSRRTAKRNTTYYFHSLSCGAVIPAAAVFLNAAM